MELEVDNRTFCGDDIEINTMLGLNDTCTKIKDEILRRPKEKCGEIFKIDSEDVDDEIFNFLCTYCSTLFEDFIIFTEHIKISHFNEKEIKLEPITFVDSTVNLELQNIEKTQNPEEYSEVIEYLNNSQNHIEKEQGKISVLNQLENHKIKNEKHSSSEKATNTMNSIKKRLKNKIFLCDKCDKEFSSEKFLKSHMKYDHMISIPFVDVPKLSNQNDSPNENTDEEKSDEEHTDFEQKIYNDPLKCRYCDKQHRNRQERYEHECLHTGEKPNICKICNKSYTRKRTLTSHLKIHKINKEFKCEICGSGFSDKSNLQVHIRRHKNEKPYNCNYCDKKFVDSTTKKLHERTHTGEKPYQCAECGKSFRRCSQLTTHNRRHTGERPHKCTYCDKTFITPDSKKFHERVHTKEKPHICDICNATFSRPHGLKQHKKIHSNITEYFCNLCGKGFKQFSGLYCHKKSHGKNLSSRSQS